jgi:membrane protein
MLSRMINFLKRDIWHIQANELSSGRSFFLGILRMVVLAVRGFDEDKLQLRASALTFFSLLALVPVAAMAFAIAKGFGLEAILERQLLHEFPGQQEVLLQVIGFANNLLERTRGSAMAIIGIIVLFWAVVKVLGHIERSFNDIWTIKKSRTLWRKFSDYLTIMLIGPMLVIASSSFTLFLKTQITNIVEKIALLGYFSPLIYMLLKLLPYGMIWLLFTLTYLLMPNTKVHFSSGLLAGIIAGTVYQLVQLAYINFQFIIAKYNAIYGSFAALPLFLAWLQISWLIVLFGAEISYAHQNSERYEFEPGFLEISHSLRVLLSLQVGHLLVHNFSNAKPPVTAHQVAIALGIPSRLVQTLIDDLVDAHIVSETEFEGNEAAAYQPALDINRLTLSYVIQALERSGRDPIPLPQTVTAEALKTSLQQFEEAVASHSANHLLKDIP